ncbi:hypothetical protein [Pseudoalteromonas 'SMAR']|uniref:AbiTii domain-containing protein n=1 Tax=Pseudoalteromonas 'SMAR' TaxID=3416908 RepID=UPI003AF2586D
MDRVEEARSLCEEILKNVELSELPLHSIILKASRVARLMKDSDMQEILQYEASGYPNSSGAVRSKVFNLAGIANRVSINKDDKSGEEKKTCYVESVQEIEAVISAESESLRACDPKFVAPRRIHQSKISMWTGRLAARRAFVHSYILDQLTELNFSNLADSVFTRIRLNVDAKIASKVPEAVKKFNAIHGNLESDNPEDWSNSAHSCRRILQDLADALFPPTHDRKTPANKPIKLGPDNYINRLICYAEDQVKSKTYTEVVGSQLKYLGHRLDSLFNAAQKGSHSTISTREEAERYVVYTYMIVGDILRLANEENSTEDVIKS